MCVGLPSGVDGVDIEAEEVTGVDGIDPDEKSDEKPDDDCTEGEGGVGKSIPSSSPSIITSSSSVDGKKLRNSNSACHFDAFLNSTQTSIRPGRDSAGSRRSRWFVVLKKSSAHELR